MQKKFSILFFFFFLSYVTAQFHELGAFIGGSNYVGDIGTNKYIHPNSPAFGIIYKWNATDRYSLRAGVSVSNIKENEFRNDDLNRFSRSLKLEKNSIQEAMVGVEIIAIPFILGFKLNPNPLFVIGVEMGARYTLTDNLDGSNPENEFADVPTYKFGNISNNDWYIFTGLTISFTFGDLPCYCKD